MAGLYLVVVVLLCGLAGCREPTWVRNVADSGGAELVDGGDTALGAVQHDGGVPGEAGANTRGVAVAVPASSLSVLPGPAVSGTLVLSHPSLFHVATVCTNSLCATGGLRP
jgi:hypothetical protein